MSEGKRARSAARAVMPTEVNDHVPLFDRFAAHVSDATARAWFFVACVILVLVWLPSFFILKSIDTWQLIINTLTTIVTFLLVALLQNTQSRSDAAVQQKLNAIADALSDLMRHVGADDSSLQQDCRELRAAVGLEDRESA